MESPTRSTQLKSSNLQSISLKKKKLSHRQNTKQQKILPNEPKQTPNNLEPSYTPSITTKQKVIKQNKPNKSENSIDTNPKHSPDTLTQKLISNNNYFLPVMDTIQAAKI